MNKMRIRRGLPAWLPVLGLLIFAYGLSPAGHASSRNVDAPAQANQKIASSILADAGKAAWVGEGKSPHIIYIFFDPNCPYCDKLYHEFRPWVEQNKVQLRWLPLGYLMTTSLGKAASILEAKDPAAALRTNETGFSRANGFGQITEDPLPRRETVRNIRANEKLLLRSGRRLVPTMVFRLADGTPVLMRGAPEEMVLQQIMEQIK